MSKYDFKIGDVFGEWTIIDSYPCRIGKNVSYKCQCRCSEVAYVRRNMLSTGKSTKCRKCSSNHLYKGLQSLSGTYYSSLKYNANKRGIEFNVSIEYLYSVFIKQAEKCALSAMDIILDRNITGRSKGMGVQTASLDRIDSSKGYIEGNVQWVHKDINFMKQSYSEEYFKELCKKIVENDNK